MQQEVLRQRMLLRRAQAEQAAARGGSPPAEADDGGLGALMSVASRFAEGAGQAADLPTRRRRE
jgi:hypothetical protein